MVFGKNSSTTKAHGMPFSPSAQYAKNDCYSVFRAASGD